MNAQQTERFPLTSQQRAALSEIGFPWPESVTDVPAYLDNLCEQHSAGNANAVYALVEIYYASLLRFATRRLSGDHNNAEDAVSRLKVQLAANPGAFHSSRATSSPESLWFRWATAILCNICVDIVREITGNREPAPVGTADPIPPPERVRPRVQPLADDSDGHTESWPSASVVVIENETRIADAAMLRESLDLLKSTHPQAHAVFIRRHANPDKRATLKVVMEECGTAQTTTHTLYVQAQTFLRDQLQRRGYRPPPIRKQKR